MLTSELRSKVDAPWYAFWSGGIANPIEAAKERCLGNPRFAVRVKLAGS